MASRLVPQQLNIERLGDDEERVEGTLAAFDTADGLREVTKPSSELDLGLPCLLPLGLESLTPTGLHVLGGCFHMDETTLIPTSRQQRFAIRILDSECY